MRADWDEANAVWSHSDLGWIFRAGHGFCEAPVMGEVGRGGRRVYGIIDRLVVQEGRVDIIDYKSNGIAVHQIPELVAHYRPQLNSYRDVLAALYPEHKLRCWLLWTHLAATGQAGCLTEVTP